MPSNIVDKIQDQLASVVKSKDQNGGLFCLTACGRLWSIKRARSCSVIVTGDSWPDSRAVAIAKAGTANGFSNDALALSTANLYSPTQPGGSLYASTTPIHSILCFSRKEPVSALLRADYHIRGRVAIYSGGKVIGGLGVSGDLRAPIMRSPIGCDGKRDWTARRIPTTSCISPQVKHPTTSNNPIAAPLHHAIAGSDTTSLRGCGQLICRN